MELKKVDCTSIKMGMRFSMPVFFDDGKNMFLAKRKSVKKYHINALTQWKIPFLLTAGEVLSESDFSWALSNSARGWICFCRPTPKS